MLSSWKVRGKVLPSGAIEYEVYRDIYEGGKVVGFESEEETFDDMFEAVELAKELNGEEIEDE